MSKEQAAMNNLMNMMSFIKERILSDLNEAKKAGMIDIDEQNIQKLSRVVTMSIDSSFSKSSSPVLKSLKATK